MSNKIIVGPIMLVRESDEAISIVFTDTKTGNTSRAVIGMNHALEMAKELINWVCHSWLE
jgi:hypothetical protein